MYPMFVTGACVLAAMIAMAWCFSEFSRKHETTYLVVGILLMLNGVTGLLFLFNRASYG